MPRGMAPFSFSRRRRVLASLAASVATAAAWAQAPPTPGTLIEGLQMQRPPLQGGSPAEFIFPKDGAAPAHGKDGRRFFVKGFHFEGNTVFTEARLRRVLERFVDLQLNLHDLSKAADAVTRYYRDQGFPVASAFVPAQKVDDGLVVIQVLEGKLGALAFSGGRRYGDDMLRGYVEELAGDPQITIARLERSLLLLNELPGLTARATLAPGGARGETEATIELEEKPAALTIQLNNSGRKEAGAARLDIGATLNNPLGIGDQISVRAMRAEQGLMEFRSLGYSLPLGKNGLRLSLSGSAVDYRVAGDFAALGIEGLVNSREVSLTYPLRRSRVSNIILTGGVKSTESRQTALNAPLSASRLNIATVGSAANWVHADSSATSLSATYSSNFRNNYGNDPDALRGKVELDFTHLTGISPRWDLHTRVNVMAGAGAVPDTEKFSLGGPDSVRGYRVAEYRGDRGFLLAIEFRRQYLIGGTLGILTVFHDQGAVGNAGFAGQDKLSSWGVGTSLFLGKNSRIRADVAWPTRKYVAGDGKTGPRAWVSASVSF